MRVLILCTGNSCRSQMAEGFLRQLRPDWDVFSAGTFPAGRVHSMAVRVMAELGVDISGNSPQSVDRFLDEPFDYVITVCDNARETCPAFTGNVSHRLHMGFPDPIQAIGNEEQVLAVFRQVRDEIRERFGQLVQQIST